MTSSEMMAGYCKDNVDFRPQSAQSAAQGWTIGLGGPSGMILALATKPLNRAPIRLSRPKPATGCGKTGQASGALPTYEQNFGRNIVQADARAEYRLAYRDDPVIMQHVLGDNA